MMTIYDQIVEISERLEKVRQELVPAGGKADTLEGETLRAFDRVVYRWFNDGDKYTDQKPPIVREWEEGEEEAEWYAKEYGNGYTTVRPSVKCLYENSLTSFIRRAANDIMRGLSWTDETYEKQLLELARSVEKVDWSKRTPAAAIAGQPSDDTMRGREFFSIG